MPQTGEPMKPPRITARAEIRAVVPEAAIPHVKADGWLREPPVIVVAPWTSIAPPVALIALDGMEACVLIVAPLPPFTPQAPSVRRTFVRRSAGVLDQR